MSKSIISLTSLESRHVCGVNVALTDRRKLLAPKKVCMWNWRALNFLARHEASTGGGSGEWLTLHDQLPKWGFCQVG